MITIGTRVEGNWGTMFPADEGKVVAVSESGAYVTILWDSCPAPMFYSFSDIDGSEIGIFIAAK